MSNISSKRLKEVLDYYSNHGEYATVSNFGISHETVHRYIRENNLRKRGQSNKHSKGFKLPNVLVYDIEVAPMRAWIYHRFNNYLSEKNIENDWFILTWSAKWLTDSKIYSDRLTSKEAKNEDDKRISKSLWELINDADIIIAHNGKKYDVPRMNTKFLLNGLDRPLPYQLIDTLQVAKREFAFTSNKLDFIAEVLGLEGKIETGGINFWARAKNGDKEALKEMEIYNRRDVTLLEEVYFKLRNWISSHPNLSLFVDTEETICPVCLSSEEDFEWGGYYTTMVGRYNSFRCKNCGSVGRVRKTNLSKEKNKNTVVSIAR